ncbi:hypothetical protein BpHYR1_038546 [Brachionus plicatilis]|uniref:Uncharacterized protein n=1 Tax=Brachionus plicatilis TaxID=10195 RepID=A0A3M7SNS6_BRAPC|nr:hypothetical protein BpHYR1_038546 [Brachionus plicatilis]
MKKEIKKKTKPRSQYLSRVYKLESSCDLRFGQLKSVRFEPKSPCLLFRSNAVTNLCKQKTFLHCTCFENFPKQMAQVHLPKGALDLMLAFFVVYPGVSLGVE